jgi:hypothetical protein
MKHLSISLSLSIYHLPSLCPEYIRKLTDHRACFSYQLNAQFLYSITICMLHYNPRHVSSINMPIFRRTNCIITASGIVTLCKRLYSMPDESRLQSRIKELCIKLIIETSLYYDARSEKHQIMTTGPHIRKTSITIATIMRI